MAWCEKDFGPDGAASNCGSQRTAAIGCLETLPIECDPWAKPNGEQCKSAIDKYESCAAKPVPSVADVCAHVCSLPKDQPCVNICKSLCPTEDCAAFWIKSGETNSLIDASNATSVECTSPIQMLINGPGFGLACSASCPKKTGIAGCTGTAYCCYPDSSMPDSRCSYLSKEYCGEVYCCE